MGQEGVQIRSGAARLASVPTWMVGEFLGTFLLVFFGCGSVCSAVLTGAQVGVFQVAIVWGLGIATAIYLTGALSGAHLNPAVTLSVAVWNGFPWRRVPGYWLAQMAGAIAASAVLYVVFGGALVAYEAKHGIVRGQPGSEASAMVFGDYFPNPQGKPLAEAAPGLMGEARACAAETIGTAILLLVIFGVTDPANRNNPQVLTAAAIGLTVTIVISVIGPLTMAGLNPARDLGPRLFSSWAGWGGVPFSANGRGWLTVYLVSPLAGALLGGGIYRGLVAARYRDVAEG